MSTTANASPNRKGQKPSTSPRANGSRGKLVKPVKKGPKIAYGASIEEYHDAAIARTAIRVSAVALAGFLVWAMVTPVYELAVGQGQILPAGFIQSVQHLEGGSVAEILIREGQFVNEGMPIIKMDDLSMRAELRKAQSRLEFTRLAIERQNLIASGQAAQWSSVDQFQFEALRSSQQEASLAGENYRSAQLDVMATELDMKTAELTSMGIQVANGNAELAILSQKLTDFERAMQLGAVSRRERDDVLREKLGLESKVAALQGQMELARAGVSSVEAREIELMARFKQEAVDQIAELQAQRAESEELVRQLQDRLTRSLVLAPTSGRINNLSAINSGQVLGPGELVAEIVPEDGKVYAEVEIAPDQIGFINEGMAANVKVLTYDFARFGGLDGTIIDVSPTSIMNPEGALMYRVRVELSQPYVGDPMEGRIVTPGMSITADVRLGNKSVLAYLLKPLRALSDRAFSER